MFYESTYFSPCEATCQISAFGALLKKLIYIYHICIKKSIRLTNLIVSSDGQLNLMGQLAVKLKAPSFSGGPVV
jgi:hypothetical protein